MDLGNLNFLVAEDHAFQRSNLVRMLHELGANRIVEADDGQSALMAASAGKWRPNVIICDLDMPEMDGMELVRRMVERDVSAAFILTSSLDGAILASAENMTRAYGATVLGAMAKPASPAALGALIGKFREPESSFRTVRPRQAAFSLADIADAMLDGEIAPRFQPQVDMRTGKVIGAEALVRWQHPDMGLLSPADFLGPLIAHDLIDSLTLLMVKGSAPSILKWRQAGLDLRVSMNLSRSQICDTAITGRILACLRSANLPNSNLTFEITESDAMTDVAGGLETLTRLRMKGFGLSIDDFGTGYSGMQQLSAGPYSEIKVDRCFITDIERNATRRTMVESCRNLARQLGVSLVAEGVETEEQWNTLAQIGCDVAQGYFIAPPMDADELQRWAGKWRAPRAASAMPAGAAGPRTAPDGARAAAATEATPEQNAAAELLADYRETTRADLADLEQRLASRNVQAISRCAHRICGASKVMQAHEVVAACDRVERACIDGQWEAIASSCDKLRRAANRMLSGAVTL